MSLHVSELNRELPEIWIGPGVGHHVFSILR